MADKSKSVHAIDLCDSDSDTLHVNNLASSSSPRLPSSPPPYKRSKTKPKEDALSTAKAAVLNKPVSSMESVKSVFGYADNIPGNSESLREMEEVLEKKFIETQQKKRKRS